MSQEQDPVPIAEIRRLAEQGDAASQYNLARLLSRKLCLRRGS